MTIQRKKKRGVAWTMIKTKIYGDTLKEQLLASKQDRLHRFLMADGNVRGAVIHGTRMVNEMRANHETGILETLALGHAYLAAGLMSASLKGRDRLGFKIDCSGPIKGLWVEANGYGEIRGYLKQVPIPVASPPDSFDLAPFFGAGFLSVTKYLEDAKQPFVGKVMLEFGTIAKDLANYYLTSEQIPTAFNLSIKFDKKGAVSGAGGLFLQVMPGAKEVLARNLEKMVFQLPSIGAVFSEKPDPEQLIADAFGPLSPRFIGDHRVEFMCHCNEDQIQSLLNVLPRKDLEEIRDNGPFPVNLRCHHCNTHYGFNRREIGRIYKQRFSNN